ncbi:unnamed protein product, partial [Ectocarpus sp. 13 AM-2016]
YATAANNATNTTSDPAFARGASLTASAPNSAAVIAPTTPCKIRAMSRLMACCMLNLTSLLTCGLLEPMDRPKQPIRVANGNDRSVSSTAASGCAHAVCSG